jgi:predicted DCC family thiol-disulfide oxidoreductase YuxK
VNTAIPERTTEGVRGLVIYDGECALCAEAARRFQNLLRRRGFDLAMLQAPWVRAQLGLNTDEQIVEMILLADDGEIFSGADAFAQIARKIWWAWPLFAVAQIPGAMILLRAIYRRVAANRHCLDGACPGQKPLARRHVTRVFFEIP